MQHHEACARVRGPVAEVAEAVRQAVEGGGDAEEEARGVGLRGWRWQVERDGGGGDAGRGVLEGAEVEVRAVEAVGVEFGEGDGEGVLEGCEGVGGGGGGCAGGEIRGGVAALIGLAELVVWV